MGKTIRATGEPVEDTRGNLCPHSKRTAALAATDTEGDLRHFAKLGPETWPDWGVRELGRRAAVGPWRKHHDGAGIDDWGAVPGTVPGDGAHRYYFAATRGREVFDGTVVANSARAVERWLRDQERADGFATRDPRRIAGPGSAMS